MAQEIGENTQVRSNLAFVGKVIAICGSLVWGYSVIWNKLAGIDIEIERLKHEVNFNSEFRVKWPRGELGALPDDAEQNMRLTFLEKQANKHDELLDKLRYNPYEPSP